MNEETMKQVTIQTIISGGQTGVDRAAFDFALEHGFSIAGFVPRGRRAEDGRISDDYPNLTETSTARYAERTRLNVENSDATLIISRGPLTGGTRLTRDWAERQRKPFLHIDLANEEVRPAGLRTRRWLASINCRKLNIAGPRASTDPAIYDRTKEFLAVAFLGE